jgi:FAD/FMN-containing dehydrogenase
MDLPTVGVKFRIISPDGASKDVLIADAPSLADLYDDPASNGGDDLLFYTTSTPDYAVVREFWNHIGDDVRVLAVLRPRTESAVQAAVRYLTRNKIPFSVRSGGRGAYGQGRADAGGVVVDMRAMDSMELCCDRVVGENDSCSVALVGGGIVGGTLNRWLHSEDLITASGWSSEVGFAGWLCGGGYGFTSNKWGLGADNLVGARVVLASGEVVDTDDEGHTELLWALRGAGNGNFGIVTQLRVKTYPYPGFLAGILAFPLAEAKEVQRQFHELMAATPIGLQDAMAGESMSFFPPATIPLFAFQFVWAADKDGSFHDGQTWLDKMRSLGTLTLDTVVEREPPSPFTKLHCLHPYHVSTPLGPLLHVKLFLAS